jgi:hypothetical protein
MEGSRRWTVESKEFEVLIKGGITRVRIVERSNNKQRSIFIKMDELAWLVGSVEVAVDVEHLRYFETSQEQGIHVS